MRAIKGYLDSWRIQEYLLITFFISWLSWGILILLTGFEIVKFQSIIGTILFVIGGFGPTISAIMCLEGKIGFKKVWKFITEHKKKTIGYLLLFVILMILTVILTNLAGSAELLGNAKNLMPPNLDVNGHVNNVFLVLALIISFVVVTLVGGGNEELGWRGTLQPLMEKVVGKKVKNKTLNFILTMLVVGLIWAVWHLPLWFVAGCMQQSLNYGLFVLECIALSFILGIVYQKTHSVLYCMIIHGLANVLFGIVVAGVNLVLIVGIIIMVVLSIILSSLSKPSKSQEVK